jgi:hypothetical protein
MSAVYSVPLASPLFANAHLDAMEKLASSVKTDKPAQAEGAEAINLSILRALPGDQKVTVEWATAIGIPKEVAVKLIEDEWKISVLTSTPDRFKQVLCKAGMKEGPATEISDKMSQGINFCAFVYRFVVTLSIHPVTLSLCFPLFVPLLLAVSLCALTTLMLARATFLVLVVVVATGPVLFPTKLCVLMSLLH